MRYFKEASPFKHLYRLGLPVMLTVIIAASLWFASPMGQDIKTAFGYGYSYTEEEGSTIGGGAPTPTADPDTTDVSDDVDSSGTFTDDVTAESSDGEASVTVSEGTVGKTADNDPISSLTVKKMSSLPSAEDPPANADLVLMYDFGPDGATFDTPVTLSFSYDEGDIPAGVDEADLVIVYWDGSGWVQISNISVDPATNTITGEIDHFTTFAVMAKTTPATFSVGNLSVAPAEVEAGGTVEVSVTVTNTGDLTGDYEVRVLISNVIYKKDLTLSGGESEDVVFNVDAGSLAGTYDVTVSGLSASYTIKVAPAPTVTGTPPATTAPPTTTAPTTIAPTTTAPAPTATQAPVTTPEPTSAPLNWWWIAGTIVAVIIVGVLVWFFVPALRRD